ncbi:MAG: PAS domain S-box protein [Panacibacter sp.]
MGLTEQTKPISRDVFRALLEQTKGQAVLLLDPNGQIISCNDGTERITGYSAKELNGKSFSVLYKTASEKSTYLSALDLATINGLYCHEGCFIKKDGNNLWALMSLTALKDDRDETSNFSVTLSTLSISTPDIPDIFHLAGLSERTTDAIFSTDLLFNIISWNKAAEKLYGYNRDEVIGEPLKDVVRPKISEETFKNIDDGVKQHGYWVGEVVHVNKHGQMLEIEESISVTKDGFDNVNGYVWVCRDITTIKKNERERSHLARLIENTNDAIYTAAASTNILSWNNAAEKMYGYSLAEVLNKSADEILRPQMTIVDQIELQNLITEKGHWEGEITHRKKDGTLLPVHISVHVVKDNYGGIDQFLCVCTDITELKRNEDALRKMQEEVTRLTQEKLDKSLKELEDYKYALDASSIVVATNAKGIITYVNDNFCKISMYNAQEIIGQDYSLFNLGNYQGHHAEEMWKILSNGKIWRGEIQNKTKNGIFYWVEATVVPFVDNMGIPYQYLKIAVDITEKKNAEKAFRQSEEIKGLILRSTLDAIIGIDTKGSIIMWNMQAEKIFGWKQNEVMGKLLSETIIPYHHRKAHAAGLDHYSKTGSGQMLNKVIEITALNKSNKEFPVELTIVAINQNEEEFFCAFIRDITERKSWEEKILQERSLLRILIDNIPEYIYVKDLKYRHIINNAANVALIGAISEQETLGKTVFDYFRPEIAKQFMEDDEKILRNGLSISNREELIASEMGIERWLSTTKIPLKDINQNIIGLLGISRDITEQKRAEKQLVKENELSDSIINSLPGIFYLFDSNGKFLRWNKQLETVSGYTSEEISQMTPDMFYLGDEKISSVEKRKVAFTQGSADAEADFVTKGGNIIPFFLTSISVTYDEMPCMIGMGLDISARKKAEKDLLDSEQKYRILFENNPLPMWMFTIPERDIIDVNKAAINHYGYSREEFLKLNLLDLRPEEDRLKFITETKVANAGVRSAGVWRHKKKDGTLIQVEIFRDDIVYKGQYVRLVLANDITEKFMTQQRLTESHDMLRSLASHLQDVREEERTVIAREIHDELGQQITGLKMDVSWISKRLTTEDKTIHQKIKDVLELLDETVKTVRKIASELRPSILDDLGLIDALHWYSLEFEKRFGIPLSFHTSVEEVNAAKNVAIGLFRIYQESLTNVARHAEATFINAEINIKNGLLHLMIKDNGKGFDSGITGTRKTLGLLGMKERTLMMGGEYEINSTLGEGTIVNVSVPMLTA